MMGTSRQKVHRPSLLSRITRVRFFWLLVALVVFILASPCFPASEGGQRESLVMGFLILFAATHVSEGTNRLTIMGFLIFLILINGLLTAFLDKTPMLNLFLLFSLLVAMLYTSICVLTFILDDGQVGAEHIYGGICAYVLIAMAFATVDLMLEILQPGSFSNVRVVSYLDRPWWQFFYFSFSTLSTVGYGDIVPVTMRARSIVVVQQMISVFYVAVLISRLTGMYTGGSRKPPEPTEPKNP